MAPRARDLLTRLSRALARTAIAPPSPRPRTPEEMLDERIWRLTSIEIVMRLTELKAVAQARYAAGAASGPASSEATRMYAEIAKLKTIACSRFKPTAQPDAEREAAREREREREEDTADGV